MSDYAEHPELPQAEHERTDVPPRWIALGLACVGLTVVLSGALLVWLYPQSLRDQIIRGSVPSYPAPALQPDPRADMQAFFRDQMRRLNGVWWVDRTAGRVHIPIGDAMRIVAREGIADWPKQPVDAAPGDRTLRDGTPRAAETEAGKPRNVQVDDALPETGRSR